MRESRVGGSIYIATRMGIRRVGASVNSCREPLACADAEPPNRNRPHRRSLLAARALDWTAAGNPVCRPEDLRIPMPSYVGWRVVVSLALASSICMSATAAVEAQSIVNPGFDEGRTI